MPGQMAVPLKASQGVYYNPNLLHRGIYPRTQQRQTLHCCMGQIRGTELRPHIYQTLEWMESPDFGPTLPPALRPLYDNFLKMAEHYRKREES